MKLLRFLTEYVDSVNASHQRIVDTAVKHKVPLSHIMAQIELGKKVEKEHTSNEKEAIDIALDHLDELPDYYTRLERMERSK